MDGVDAECSMERSWFSYFNAKETLIDSDEDSMEMSWFYSLDGKEMLIESDSEEVDPLVSHDEEVGSPLKSREESSNSIPIDSKESKKYSRSRRCENSSRI